MSFDDGILAQEKCGNDWVAIFDFEKWDEDPARGTGTTKANAVRDLIVQVMDAAKPHMLEHIAEMAVGGCAALQS